MDLLPKVFQRVLYLLPLSTSSRLFISFLLVLPGVPTDRTTEVVPSPINVKESTPGTSPGRRRGSR